MKTTKKLFILFIIFIITYTTYPISAASYASTGKNYTLKIAGKKQTKKSIGAAYAGTSIKTRAPGFIVSNTSMYSAYYVFKKTKSLGTTYSYSSKTKKITLKRGSKKIIYTLDSKYATVNGVKKTLPTPARKVYSYTQKKNYIYVPGNFTAKALGLGYTWRSSKRTGNFYLTSSGSAGSTIKIKYTSTNKIYNKTAINARYNNTVISSAMPGFIDGSTSMYSAYYVFGKCSSLSTKYTYSSKTKKITLKRGSNTVVMTLDSKKATLNGKSFTLPAAPRKVYYYTRMANYIMIPGEAVAKKLGLNYSWNNRLLSGVITKPVSSSSTSSSSGSSTVSSGSATKITASSSNYSIRIKKPSGLSSSNITANDDYKNKRLQIIVNGNYKTHFSSSGNRTIKDSLTYSVSYTGGKTYINLKTSTIKGFSVTQNASYIYVKYAAPKSMFKRVIVVDAGHGGTQLRK